MKYKTKRVFKIKEFSLKWRLDLCTIQIENDLKRITDNTEQLAELMREKLAEIYHRANCEIQTTT